MKILSRTESELNESRSFNPESNVIKIIMYLHPVIYDNSELVLGSVTKKKGKYVSDNNQFRSINGPLSEYGDELEAPLEYEYERFIEDCKLVIKDFGFTIIKQYRSSDSKKSEYVVVLGLEDEPCTTLIYEIRISDHPFDASFPEDLKDEVVKYLNMHYVMDGTAHEAGIDFQVEKVTVGGVINDTWDRALNRLAKTLNGMKNAIRRRSNIKKNQKGSKS